MRTLIHLIKVSFPGLVASGLFIVVWLLFRSLTGYFDIKYCVYPLLIPFVFTLMNKWTKDSDRLMRWLSIILAFFFAACCALGYSISITHSLDLCFGSKALFAISILKVAIYSYVFYKIILCAFSNVIWYHDNKSSVGEKNLAISNYKLFVFFVICRIPYLVVFYPCLFDYDAAVSLSSFGDGRVLYDHHPFLVACLQKAFFELGKCLGDPSIGLALFSLLFILFVSALFVYVIRFCGRLGAGLRLQKWLVLLFAFLPFFSLLNIYDTKDGIFAYSSLFFVATLADLLWRCKKGEIPKKRLLLMHGIAVILICFSRHQGIYFVLAQYLLLFLFFRSLAKRISYAYLPGIVAYFFVVRILYPYIGVAPASKNEMIGVMLQQSALCMITEPEMLTDEEKQAFTALVNVDPDTLKYLYDYTVTDPVKSRYRYKPVIRWSVLNNYSSIEEKEALSTYLRSWLTTFFRLPGTCVLASLNLVNGFFYNTEGIFCIEGNWKSCPYLLPEYDFYCRTSFASCFNHITGFLSRTPLLEFIFSKAYYTWLYIFFFVVFIYRRDMMGLVIFATMFLTLGLFFISPTSTYRYSLPLIVNAALIMFYSTHAYGKKRQKNCGTDTLLQREQNNCKSSC